MPRLTALLVHLRQTPNFSTLKRCSKKTKKSYKKTIDKNLLKCYTVVKAVPGFTALTEMLMGVGGSPLVAVALAVNVLCGATGSASGGLGLALEALSERFAEMSVSSGIPMETFHRVASLASGGLDSLPHNGGVVTCLAVCGLSHKESYLDICVTSVVIPVITTIIAVILASAGIVF